MFNLAGNTSVVSISIYNPAGQLVNQLSSAGESLTFDLTGFSKGIYTVKITGKKINGTKKPLID